jgi:hypothetical protein
VLSLLREVPAHRRNIPKAVIAESGVVKPAWTIEYVRYPLCCRHFRRAEIGGT